MSVYHIEILLYEGIHEIRNLQRPTQIYDR